MPESKFVGRQAELGRLQQFLDTASAGASQVVFIAGEAGSGKTALVNAFVNRAEDQDDTLVAALGECDAQTGAGDAYLPFREVLTALTTGMDEAKPAGKPTSPQQAHRLKEFVRVASETLFLVGPDLIGVFVPGASLVTKLAGTVAFRGNWADKLAEQIGKPGKTGGAPGASPTLDQTHIFEEYAGVLSALAKQRPLLLILDDLHWADSGSLNLLFHLARKLAGSRVMIVGTYRPDDVALGRDGQRHPFEPILNEIQRYRGDVVINLGAAQASEGRAFVDALVDAEPNRLDETFRQELFARTDGQALFTVETLRNLRERGDLLKDGDGKWVQRATLNWEQLPARVEGVIEERIARLADDLRAILNVGSVVGIDFTAQVIARVQQAQERELLQQLSQQLERRHRLVQDEGEVEVGSLFVSHYRFAHALFQHYLYHALGPGQRRLLHAEVADALEVVYAGFTDAVTVQLAYHFQAARLPEKAVHYLTLAGEQAVRAVAYTEASSHFTQALAQLATLPETTERVQRELALLLSLGAVLTALKGYTDPEVAHTYSRMRAILPKFGQDPQIFPALMALERFYSVEGERRLQYEVAEQALQLAQAAQDPKLLMGGHQVMGTALCFSGHYSAARAHLEQSLALYDPQVAYTMILPDDPGVVAGSFLGWTLWRLGFADQALLRSQAALRLAQGLANHLYRETAALSLMAMLHQWRRDAPAARQAAEAAIGLAAKHRFSFWEELARVVYGWALAAQGEGVAGMVQARRGVAAIRTMHVVLFLPPVLALLAETCGQTDQVAEGLTLAAEALQMADRSFHWMAADLHLVQGVLQLQQVHGERAAEVSLQRALALARGQEAKLMELRATVHLARLWRTQGKSQEARQMLAELYGWFSEGFDSVDLREAKALLEQLQMAGAE